ncbi:MAG TPA: hypothetical protein VLH41_00055 [Thermoanaerobaculia bacterium]|nr:hypothetical protein [Thermoanaerobaculia bacterium]
MTVYDGNGSQIGQTTYALGTAGVQQISVSRFATAADVARATIEVTAGRAAGYSAVVDNVTGDSSLFTFDDLPAGPQDVLINGMARANGKNGTFFRTDGRFFNPGAQDVLVTASFHASGSSNPSPATGTVVVPAGKVVDVTDVLGTVLSQPVGSSGAVRIQAGAPVGILCRTSNVDPTGVNPGTFGAQQKPVPLLSFLTSADAGALVTGVRQSADPATGYRTNLALAAGPDGATAQFTLKTAQGATAGTATQSLGAFGWVQTAVDKLFAAAIPDDAEILVKLTKGSADVFDSSVDNRSGDSVVTPAPALSVSIPTTATIGPEGGSIRSDDGRLTLKIPAGALAAPAPYSIATVANGAPGGVGAGYAISDPGVPFARPLRMVLGYGRRDADGSSPAWLGVAWQGASSWYAVSSQFADTSARTVTFDVPSLQLAAAAAPAGRSLLDHGEEYYSPYVALGITGRPVVLQGDPLRLTVQQVRRTPLSTGILRLAPEAELQNFSYAWSLEEAAQGSSAVGSVTPFGFGNEANYAAPACPPQTRVHVRVDVLDVGSGGPIGVMTKPVRVLWKDWTFKMTESVHEICTESLAFSYDSQVEVDFSLDDGGNATNVRILDGTSTNSVSTCPPPQACTYAQTNPPPLSIESFNVNYGPASDRLIFYCDFAHVGESAYSFSCPGGSQSRPSSPGRADRIAGAPASPVNGGGDGATTSISEWSYASRPMRGACP